MGVNSLPKTVTRQRRGCDLNQGPSAPESSTLTTRLPSHPESQLNYTNMVYSWWLEIPKFTGNVTVWEKRTLTFNRNFMSVMCHLQYILIYRVICQELQIFPAPCTFGDPLYWNFNISLARNYETTHCKEALFVQCSVQCLWYNIGLWRTDKGKR